MPLPTATVTDGGAAFPFVGPPPMSSPMSSPSSSAGRFVGRLRRDVDVEHLAGDSRPPPIVLPVKLTLVLSAVGSFEEVRDLALCSPR